LCLAADRTRDAKLKTALVARAQEGVSAVLAATGRTIRQG
jgi:hypothetical protein